MVTIAKDRVTTRCKADPKWSAVVNDSLFPMPRRRLTVRAILDQAGLPGDCALVRDHNAPDDPVFQEDEMIDLGEGNVFRSSDKRGVPRRLNCNAPAKLAFAVDDAWEVTVTPGQTGASIRRLFGISEGRELLRDYESPNDDLIADDEDVTFADGPVFRTVGSKVTITVNNNEVVFDRRRVTGLEIKQAAIAQGVAIDVGCVLYRVKAEGGLSAAIEDCDVVVLTDCAAFRCVAPDDNS